MTTPQYQEVDITLIDRPEDPIRLTLDDPTLDDLCRSICTEGILVPLLLRPIGDRFRVIAGDRRLACAWKCRIQKIPAVVRDIDDREEYVLRALENLQRKNPDPVSEAVYIQVGITKLGLTPEYLAERFDRSVEWVKDRLAIAEMPDFLKDLLRQELLPLGVALLLAQIDDEKTLRDWVAGAIQDGMTVVGAREALAGYYRLRDRQRLAGNPEASTPVPYVPVVIRYACVACQQHDLMENLMRVWVHREQCVHPDTSPPEPKEP